MLIKLFWYIIRILVQYSNGLISRIFLCLNSASIIILSWNSHPLLFDSWQLYIKKIKIILLYIGWQESISYMQENLLACDQSNSMYLDNLSFESWLMLLIISLNKVKTLDEIIYNQFRFRIIRMLYLYLIDVPESLLCV